MTSALDRSVLVELTLAYDDAAPGVRAALADALEELGDYERGLADALRRPGVRPPNLISRALARA